MSVYKEVSKMGAKKFRRLTGVKKTTFEVMVEILKEAEEPRRRRGGRKRKLSIENILLMLLQSLREYRTLLAMSTEWGLSPSQAQRTCRWAEEVLIADKRLHLPGKKALKKGNTEISMVVIDATECPTQRPKKTEKWVFRKKEDAYTESAGCD